MLLKRPIGTFTFDYLRTFDLNTFSTNGGLSEYSAEMSIWYK